MGAQNVTAVYLCWSKLPHRAFRLLVHMALVSLDSPTAAGPACLYFKGRDELAQAIGLEPGPTAYREVRRELATLRRAGAIERMTTGTGARRTRYRVHPFPPSGGVSHPPSGGVSHPPSGGVSHPPGGGVSHPPGGGVSHPPGGTTRGTTKENSEEYPLRLVDTDQLRVRDRKATRIGELA